MKRLGYWIAVFLMMLYAGFAQAAVTPEIKFFDIATSVPGARTLDNSHDVFKITHVKGGLIIYSTGDYLTFGKSLSSDEKPEIIFDNVHYTSSLLSHQYILYDHPIPQAPERGFYSNVYLARPLGSIFDPRTEFLVAELPSNLPVQNLFDDYIVLIERPYEPGPNNVRFKRTSSLKDLGNTPNHFSKIGSYKRSFTDIVSSDRYIAWTDQEDIHNIIRTRKLSDLDYDVELRAEYKISTTDENIVPWQILGFVEDKIICQCSTGDYYDYAHPPKIGFCMLDAEAPEGEKRGEINLLKVFEPHPNGQSPYVANAVLTKQYLFWIEFNHSMESPNSQAILFAWPVSQLGIQNAIIPVATLYLGQLFPSLKADGNVVVFHAINDQGNETIRAAKLPRIFNRGDVDDDSVMSITDALFTLNYLFREGKSPNCQDAADVDDNGLVNLTDVVAILKNLFLGGSSFPEPYDIRGFDPTDDTLPCEN